MLPPAAFMSYATFDDKNDGGLLSSIREKLSNEVRARTGKEFQIFQDKEHISWGQEWEKRIDSSLETSTFLIAFITPNFFSSEFCKKEIETFLKKESRLGLRELIFPVYYIKCDQIEQPIAIQDQLVKRIRQRQMYKWVEWRDEGNIDLQQPEAMRKIREMAEAITLALQKTSRHIEGVNQIKACFQRHLDSHFSTHYSYQVSDEERENLLSFASSFGLNREIANRFLNEEIQNKKSLHSQRLNTLKIRGKNLITQKEIQFSHCYDFFTDVFDNLPEKRSLNISDPQVNNVRNILYAEYLNASREARKTFKRKYKKWLLNHDSEDSTRQAEVSFLQNELNLSSGDIDEVLQQISRELELQEFKEQLVQKLGELRHKIIELWERLLVEIPAIYNKTMTVVSDTISWIRLDMPYIVRAFYLQKVKPYYEERLMPNLHIFWQAASREIVLHWSNLNRCLKDRILPLIDNVLENAFRVLSSKYLWMSIGVIFVVTSTPRLLMSARDLFIEPMTIRSFSMIDEIEQSILEKQNFIEALVKRRISEYLEARENAYGEGYDLGKIRSLAFGQTLSNIETKAFDLSIKNEFIAFPVSELKSLRKIDFDSDSIYAEAEFHELRELYSVGDGIARFSTCEYIEAKMIFEQHNDIWKVSQLNYSNKKPCVSEESQNQNFND